MTAHYGALDDREGRESNNNFPTLTRWVLVNSLGFVLAINMFYFVSGFALAFSFFDRLPPSTDVNKIMQSLIYPVISIPFGASGGLVLAIYQTRALTRNSVRASGWFKATMSGAGIGYTVLVLGLLARAYMIRYGIFQGIPPFLAFTVAIVFSIPQAIILRRQRQNSVFWILTSMITFGVALISIYSLLGAYPLAFLLILGLSLLYAICTYLILR